MDCDWNEIEDYGYVDEMLMPEAVFGRLFHDLSMDFDFPTTVNLLAEAFHVSSMSVRSRLVDLRLV